ncbi:Polyketide synthase [Halomicronema hongdechloris C2206]|uniref:Polyketide synthase n=1 Tax=Halomicronema hongdechloris C2206 TaxID=1641165 RepID=A0A1Z3HK75_9CYAN|nr:alpha/beta hydrolase [Halomicronema hongdechloris]ASC70487.1 Polyketide synthase [Halomicronema hongdechloris C2206]
MGHGEGRFSGADGLELYYQSWYPAPPMQAVVGVVHGLGSHGGQFTTVVEGLVTAGYGVYALDLRGHGRSPGQRGYIQSWGEFRQDVQAFQQRMAAYHPQLPCFLLGHSLGAIILLDHGLHSPRLWVADPSLGRLGGVIVLAPAIGPVGVSPLKLAIGKILSWLWPRFTLDTGIPEEAGSQDAAVVAAYSEDPLRHRKGTARLVTEFMQTTQCLRTDVRCFPVPLLILQGSQDRVALPQGSRRFYQQLQWGDVEYREYAGAYHDLHNDVVATQVTADILEWLGRHRGMQPWCYRPNLCDLTRSREIG